MKKLLLSGVLCLFFASCATIMPSYYQMASSLDYSKYVQQGFFITEANSVSFPYKPVASVIAVAKSGKDDNMPEDPESTEPNKDAVYGTIRPTSQQWKNIRYARPEDVLEELYKKAKALGADGIINLKVEVEMGSVPVGNQLISAPQGYIATGMAIRRPVN